MSILTKRLQQGVFEALATHNRFGGSGGGSGLNPLFLYAQGGDGNADTITTTTFSVIPGTSQTFSIPRTMTLWIALDSTGKVAGAAGNFASLAVFMDGTQFLNAGIWDKAVGGFTQVSLTSNFGGPPTQLGNHTVDLRVKVDNAALTWTNNLTGFIVFGPN